MQLREIMDEQVSDAAVTDGLRFDEELYSLQPDLLGKFPPFVPIVDADGRAIGTLERDKLINVLKADSVAGISRILECLPIGVVAIDNEGIVFFANLEYANLLERPLKEIIGNHIDRLTPNSAILTCVKTGKPIELKRRYLETIHKNVSGKIHPIYIKGTLKGAVSVFSDTTIAELQNRVEEARSEVRYLRQRLKSEKSHQDSTIIGQSSDFLKLMEKAVIVAETEVPVLIRGENGVGKEILAKYIHSKSARADKPFVVVNCAAIPDNLIESEMFGYESGSFTGAKLKGKMGKFELANGGTLFLDEIGDMPVMMQAKLLRAIQENEIEKIGSERIVSVDVRIITATNQALEDMIAEKRFRRDLYYRINTVTLAVPPLRDRKEDIILFMNHFLEECNEKYGKNVRLSDEVFVTLLHYEWPGNVRELKHFIENTVIMCTSDYYDKGALTEYFGNALAGSQNEERDIAIAVPHTSKTLSESLEEAEKYILAEALRNNRNNRTEIIKSLGVSRRTFYRKLNKHSLI
jgi:transcriptional regulator with PAS, ATPase and Fis domain